MATACSWLQEHFSLTVPGGHLIRSVIRPHPWGGEGCRGNWVIKKVVRAHFSPATSPHSPACHSRLPGPEEKRLPVHKGNPQIRGFGVCAQDLDF